MCKDSFLVTSMVLRHVRIHFVEGVVGWKKGLKRSPSSFVLSADKSGYSVERILTLFLTKQDIFATLCYITGRL